MRWSKYWSFRFSISPSNEHSVFISFRTDWFHLLALKGTLKSLLQQYNSNAPILRLSAFFSSVDKESACNAGDLDSIPGSGRSAGERIGYPTPVFLGFPGGSAGKESACSVGDLGLMHGLGSSPREGNGYPLQYSGLENPMDRGAWWATTHGVMKS